MTYGVNLKITGQAYIEIEADDEASALDEAICNCAFQHIMDWEPTRRGADVEVVE